MSRYKTTQLGIIFAVFLFLFAVVFELDLFEMILAGLHKFEHLEIDEVIIPFIIVATCFIVDILKHKKEHEVEIEKLKIYEAMLSSSHHILNNFLNKITLVKITAEENENFPQDVLDIIDSAKNEASVEIKALSSVTDINDKAIIDSVYPK